MKKTITINRDDINKLIKFATNIVAVKYNWNEIPEIIDQFDDIKFDAYQEIVDGDAELKINL